jgi:photosystem II stability/assembly factor-like uncharacterized protein
MEPAGQSNHLSESAIIPDYEGPGMKRLIWIFVAGSLLLAQTRFNEDLTAGLRYRNIGPFRAGGWVSDIAVPEAPQKAHLDTIYVGVRNGGVWKTTNAGVTWEPIFDNQDVMSIGAVAVSPKDPETVWVGTGDAYFARSPYWGDGVYKSTNGGRTWDHLGLEDTQHIAKIVIDPQDPNTVYVAAAGHAYTPNTERGIFKTTDGGKTWTKSLYIDDHTAAIDLLMDTKNPKVLYAAAWYRMTRRPLDPTPAPPPPGTPVPNWGGIYKTTDGGAHWQKLENGLPAGRLGRIGLAMYVKDPRIVYAIIDNQNRRPLTEAEKQRAQQASGRQGSQGRPAAAERPIGSEIYRTDDSGRTWRKMNAVEDDPGSKAPGTFTMIRVDTENPDRIYSLTSDMLYSNDGGKTWPGLQRGPGGFGAPREEQQWSMRPNRPGILLANSFGDYRTLWIDPQNSKRWLIGSDGGVFASWDGGETAMHFANLPLGEINGIAVDNDNPYHVYVGEQDHEHWKGPVNSWSGGIGPEEWITVGSSDGENEQVDPTDSRWVYTTSENGQHYRVDQKTYTRTAIVPRRAPGQPPLRFAWTAPIRLSPHDPAILYTGAQVVLRSMDRGDHWQEISPDLTIDPMAPQPPPPAPGAPPMPPRGANITTLCESPAAAGLGVIWVGTSNGRVHVTRDAGATWKDVTANIPVDGPAAESPVTRVVASKFAAGTAYVTKSKYNLDDGTPLVFRTTDFGATWVSIAGNLPKRPVNVLLEDPVKADLLFVGTDAGAFASLDGGKRWVSIRGNMPQVSVYDMTMQPRESELVLGSYGRGVWITNIAPLREMTEENLAKAAYFFAVRPEGARETRAMGNYRFHGFNNLVTPNEPSGLKAYFYLREEPKDRVSLTVSDVTGGEVWKLTFAAKQGLNRAVWNLRDGKRQLVAPGEYLMTLEAAGQKLSQKVRVLDPVVMMP